MGHGWVGWIIVGHGWSLWVVCIGSWWGGVGPSGMGWPWLGGVDHNKVGTAPQLWSNMRVRHR